VYLLDTLAEQHCGTVVLVEHNVNGELFIKPPWIGLTCFFTMAITCYKITLIIWRASNCFLTNHYAGIGMGSYAKLLNSIYQFNIKTHSK
jgi:hypothetical protein